MVPLSCQVSTILTLKSQTSPKHENSVRVLGIFSFKMPKIQFIQEKELVTPSRQTQISRLAVFKLSFAIAVGSSQNRQGTTSDTDWTRSRDWAASTDLIDPTH